MKRCILLLITGSLLVHGQWKKFGSRGEAALATAPAVQTVQTYAAGPLELPAGLLMNLHVNERLSSRLLQPNEPILFDIARAVRPFRTGPSLPSGALVAARVVESKLAGRFVGKAMLDIAFEEILLPTGERYPITAKVVEARGLGVEASGKIRGRGHARADAILYAFPLTAPFRVMMIPARGPDIRFKGEQLITIKLLDSVTIGPSQ